MTYKCDYKQFITINLLQYSFAPNKQRYIPGYGFDYFLKHLLANTEHTELQVLKSIL